jgi:hypothetical protein
VFYPLTKEHEPVDYFSQLSTTNTDCLIDIINLNHLKIATIIRLSIGCDFISSIFIVATFAVIFSRYLYNGCILQSVPITNKDVSSNPTHGEVHSIQHCVIKFVSDFRQVCGFLWVLWFPPPIKQANSQMGSCHVIDQSNNNC